MDGRRMGGGLTGCSTTRCSSGSTSWWPRPHTGNRWRAPGTHPQSLSPTWRLRKGGRREGGREGERERKEGREGGREREREGGREEGEEGAWNRRKEKDVAKEKKREKYM